MIEVSADTSNFTHLWEFFNELSVADRRKLFQAAFRKATKPMIADAKANAPIRSGRLQRSIGYVAIRGTADGEFGAIRRKKGWHGHLVEFGTVERFRKTKGGAATGRMPARPFVIPAYEAHEEYLMDSLADELMLGIDRQIIRINKKMK